MPPPPLPPATPALKRSHVGTGRKGKRCWRLAQCASTSPHRPSLPHFMLSEHQMASRRRLPRPPLSFLSALFSRWAPKALPASQGDCGERLGGEVVLVCFGGVTGRVGVALRARELSGGTTALNGLPSKPRKSQIQSPTLSLALFLSLSSPPVTPEPVCLTSTDPGLGSPPTFARSKPSN